MVKKQFQLIDRFRSFKFAITGIWTMLKSQHNAWIHLCVTVVVIVAGFIFEITRSEWCLLILTIVIVWMAEALNTALEFLADAASPEYHPLVKHAKDVVAGAVLISAIGAVIVGLLIFGPRLLMLMK